MNKKRILALLAAISISTCAVPVFAEEAAFPVEIEFRCSTRTGCCPGRRIKGWIWKCGRKRIASVDKCGI